MPEKDQGFADELQKLTLKYVAHAGERLTRMNELIAAFTAGSAGSDALKEMLTKYHWLSGSGRTYGFPEVTIIGARGEAECASLIAQSALPAQSDLSRWCDYVVKLQEAFSQGKDQGNVKRFLEKAESLIAHDDLLTPEIVLVSSQEKAFMPLKQRLEEIGMRVNWVKGKSACEALLRNGLPDGVVIDTNLPDGSCYELVHNIRNYPGGDLSAVILVAAKQGFLNMLEATHAGADASFERWSEQNSNWEGVCSKLAYLLAKNKQGTYKILYVEDDPDQALYVESVLSSAGYEVRLLAEPEHFERELRSFKPDLVLLDILLPDLNGQELAAWARQQDEFASLPILFLSTQSQIATRIRSARAGGDEHIVKPIHPALLLSTVAAHLERHRFVRHLAKHDALTKLLNHTAFWQEAEKLCKRQSQKETPICLALFDVDGLTKINHEFGLEAGDNALCALARLWSRHLKRTDLLGRHSGEHMVALIEGLSEDEARELCVRLCREFAGDKQKAPDGKVFRATMSCGLVKLNRPFDLHAGLESSRQALLQAKSLSGNQVYLNKQMVIF